jgi:thiamine kinase-like enzyme
MRPEIALTVLGVPRAAVIRSLHISPLAHNWLVEYGDELAVLRIDQPAAAAMGLDRASEFARLESVAAAGLGLAPVAADPARGLLLRRHIEGSAWQPADLRQAGNPERAAVLLRTVHAAQIMAPALDLAAAIERYARLAGQGVAGLAAAAREQFARCRDPQAALVCCHNDPVASNFVAGPGGAGRLWLIDWEYSGFNEFWFDLAVVVAHHGLSSGPTSTLLGAYLGRVPRPDELQRLADWSVFYDSLAALWGAALNQLMEIPTDYDKSDLQP